MLALLRRLGRWSKVAALFIPIHVHASLQVHRTFMRHPWKLNIAILQRNFANGTHVLEVCCPLPCVLHFVLPGCWEHPGCPVGFPTAGLQLQAPSGGERIRHLSFVLCTPFRAHDNVVFIRVTLKKHTITLFTSVDMTCIHAKQVLQIVQNCPLSPCLSLGSAEGYLIDCWLVYWRKNLGAKSNAAWFIQGLGWPGLVPVCYPFIVVILLVILVLQSNIKFV